MLAYTYVEVVQAARNRPSVPLLESKPRVTYSWNDSTRERGANRKRAGSGKGGEGGGSVMHGGTGTKLICEKQKRRCLGEERAFTYLEREGRRGVWKVSYLYQVQRIHEEYYLVN